MNRHSVNRMRALSINSILTIIVLISISGGRASGQEGIYFNLNSKDAGLLVTAKFLKYVQKEEGYEGSWPAIITDAIRQEKNGCSSTFLVNIDGEDITDERWKVDRAELSPGQHKIRCCSYIQGIYGQDEFYPYHTFSLDVKPHGVYVLIIEYHRRGSFLSLPTKIIKVSTEYDYQSFTGIATHPTDGNLSFKVK